MLHLCILAPGQAAMATRPPHPKQQPHGGPGVAADAPVFVEMLLPQPQQLGGLITDGLVLRCSGDRSSVPHGNSEEILRLLAGDALVEEFDDPSWSTFPQVAATLQAFDPSWKECFCVAVCHELRLWAVGVANKSRDRRGAARIALASAIAGQSLVAGGALPERLSHYQAFMAFLVEISTTLGTKTS